MLPATARSDRSYSSMLRLISESMLEARFSMVWRASSSSPWRMSIMTLAQIAEKPITVATDDAISSFADTPHGSLAMLGRPPNSIDRSRSFWMRRNHCCRLKWRQRCMNELTVGCRRPADSHDRLGAAPPGTKVNDYDALRDYLKKQTLPEFV